MNKVGFLSGAVVLVLLGAATASAQTPSARHSLTGFAGAHRFDLGGKFEEEGTRLRTSIDFGGRYQYDVNERWGIEVNLLFSPGTAAVNGEGGREVDVNAFYSTFGVVFTFPTESRLVPYVTGGAGSVTYDVGDGGDSDASLALYFGGGLLYRFDRGLAIRVDARDLVSYTGSLSPQSLAALRLPGELDEVIHDLSVTAGLSISF